MSAASLVIADGNEVVDSLCVDHKLIAGATDIGVGGFSGLNLVDVSCLGRSQPPAAQASGGVRVSGIVPLSRIMTSEAKIPNALSDAIEVFASPQIRNRATIGGNLANASPAADTVPALMVANATAVVRSRRGIRQIPIEDLNVAPGRTSLEEDEWIESVEMSIPPVSGFRKLGHRNALAIAVVSLGWSWSLGRDRALSQVKVTAGAAAPTVVRCRTVEEILEGEKPTPELFDEAARAAGRDIEPIDDIRASRTYRLAAFRGLIRELGIRTVAAASATRT